MRLLLPLMMASGVAHAATITVPDDQPTVAAAVAAAAGGDTILLQPGLHVIDSQIVVNKNLTITSEFPPREIDDVDIVEDTLLYLDVITVSAFPGFDGAFLIRPNRSLVFENIRFKQYEAVCSDQIDNDGNGLTDDDDPACFGDTDTSEVNFVGTFVTDVRAFNVREDANLTIRSSELQGWSWAVEGNVIRAENSNSVTIENSRFISNYGTLGLLPNGDFSRSRGIIYSRGARVEIYDSLFDTNRHKYGGAVFATDGSIVIADDNAFTNCEAEDGGAFFIESSSFSANRNFFVGNNAVITPGNRLFTTYEGGAVYAEDSAVEMRNNVFLRNGSLDWAAAVMVRRAFDENEPPTFINNTFVGNNPNLVGGASVMIDDTTVIYKNNISVGEGSGALGAQGWLLGTIPVVQYNDFFTSDTNGILVGDLSGLAVDTVTNIFTDPEFVYYADGAHNDWRLWRFWLDPLSPAVDAGDPTILDVGGSRSDMGAYGGAQSGVEDKDGDGWVNIYDCDDNDPDRKPYQLELCNDIDDDCNGIVDDRERAYYVDEDFDGYGDDSRAPVRICPEDTLPPLAIGVYTELSGDCNDDDNLVSPGRPEYCDSRDNDCDGDIDEDITTKFHYIDRDLDGFGDPDTRLRISVACPPEGFSPFNDDCNDADPTVHPLVTTARRSHLPLANAPLERHEADRDPDYVGDGIDQDCNRADLCYQDLDRDGYGAAPEEGREPIYINDNDLNCRNLSGFTAVNDDDCDDGDAKTYPNGREVAGDGLDQNCDGFDLCYVDLDGDGYGTDKTVRDNDLLCDNASSATASKSGDCNDKAQGGAEINPDAEEVCDGVDNDCNGRLDEVESPNAQEYFVDADGDGFGDSNPDTKIRACGNPIGYTQIGGDCDDNQPRAFPGNQEVCDLIDNNCVSGVDEETAIDVSRWYEDRDNDSYGNRDVYRESCYAPTDGGPWVQAGLRPLDCDDTDNTIGPCLSCEGCSNLGPEGSLPLMLGMLSLGLIRRRRTSGEARARA